HTAWVLARLGDLHRLRPDLPAQVGSPELWRQLYWGGFIHDWGKVAAGFQLQVRPGGKKWGKRHEVLSLAFLPYVAEPFTQNWRWIAAAIASHHRDRGRLQDQYNVGTG